MQHLLIDLKSLFIYDDKQSALAHFLDWKLLCDDKKKLSSRYSTYIIWGWWRLKVNYIFWDRLWSLQLILLKGLFQQSSHLSLGKVFNYTELPLLTHTLWTKLGHSSSTWGGGQVPQPTCFWKWLFKSCKDPDQCRGCYSLHKIVSWSMIMSLTLL